MKRILIICLVLLTATSAFSWDIGHKRLAKELENLVPFIKEKLNVEQRRSLVDSYSMIVLQDTPLPAATIGTEGIQYMNTAKIFTTSQLADIRSLPHMHYLLIQALKRRQYEAATFWSGCISYNVNENTSPNTLPAVNFFTDLSSNMNTTDINGKKINTLPASDLYIDRIFNLPNGQNELKKLRESYKPSSIGETAIETTKYLATLPIHLRNSSFVHGAYLVQNMERMTFSTTPNSHNGEIAVARMGISSIIATADILNSAWDIATNNKKFKPEEILDSTIESESEKLLMQRTLTELPIFKQVYANEKTGAIGVLAEPFFEGKQSTLGYTSRYTAAAIMGTLKAQKASYRSLNLITIIKNGFPNPREMPILIVPANNMGSGYRWIKKRDLIKVLQTYAEAGGKVLWIASERATFLGDFSFELKDDREDFFYTPSQLNESEIHYLNNLTSKGKTGTYKEIKTNYFPFNLPPNPLFPWADLKNVLKVNEGEKVKPLVYLVNQNNEAKCLAGYFPKAGAPEKAQHIAISSLALFPNILSPNVKSIATPALDEVSEEILTKFLEMLK